MASVGSWFGAAIGTVITPLKDMFFKHAMYCFNPGKYVRDHDRDTRTLIGRRSGVQDQIDDGNPNGLIATGEANCWLDRATRAISEEETNHRRYDNRGRTCSLNCCVNYKIAKRAVEARREVGACLDSIPGNATVKRPPPFAVDIHIQSAQVPSQESIFQNACECINNNPLGMIGLWGPDGVENTYLLKKINNSFVGSDSPYFVIFVTASRECSVQTIQDQIIQRLEIGQDDNQATRTTKISELLRERSFLVLLDDLREKLDLPALGIPHPLGTQGQFKRKVVITSRSESICHLMDVAAPIEVPRLEHDEALQLFKQIIGQQNLYEDPHIGPLATYLVKELKGLSSDLINIGKVMRKQTDTRQWENVIQAVEISNLRTDDPLSVTGKIVKDLEDANKYLLAKSDDISCMIEIAKRNGKKSTNEVDRWLEKVATISSGVQVIFNNYKLNKDIAMEAADKFSEIQECLKACPKNDNIALESVPPPAREIPGPSMSVENRNIKEALRFIKDGPVGMIGIWGPGGVGKTYLLNSINNSIAVAGGMSFYVIFVTASRGCSVGKIQGDFLVNLGMKADGNVKSQRQKIFNFLKNRSFLVLLDDLWEQIDLQAVGVPYPLGTVNQLKRKVVLTTRLRNVCGEMEVREELNVTCLQEDEAWKLFQEKVGQKTLTSDPRIEALARELVKELKGLPLALEVIGRTMYAKGLIHWESAIKHMQLSRYGNMETIFNQLKFSYDSLRNKTLRDCFLTCALWPEDWKIDKVDLARCWMGLGLVGEGDIESSYTEAYMLMDDLRDASLIESWGNWYGYVKVHDVIRDMALWISCGCGDNNDKWFVHARVGEEEKMSIPWSKAEYISLMLYQIQKFPPSNFNLCPMKLRMLCLQSSGLAQSVAKTIRNFTSLTYLDLSHNCLKYIPDELCCLVNLEHLDLSHNHLIQQVPRCFRNLMKLKFLYLLCTGIQKIPVGVISKLKALQVIDLRTCMEFCGEVPTICKPVVFRELDTLAHLKAVSIEGCGFRGYESLMGAAELPVRSLSLTRLRGRPEFCLSDISSLGFVQRTLYELEILGSEMELIIVRHELGQQDYCFPTLNKISLCILTKLKEIRWTGRSPASVFPRLTFLRVHACFMLEHLSWTVYLPCLEQLVIELCSLMKQAFLGPTQHRTFPCLKRLRLVCNRNLVTIGDPDVMFPSLERLELDECPKLERLPFRMHSLPLK